MIDTLKQRYEALLASANKLLKKNADTARSIFRKLFSNKEG